MMKKKTYTRVNPHPRKYATNAERQRTYRKRCSDERAKVRRELYLAGLRDRLSKTRRDDPEDYEDWCRKYGHLYPELSL
jgi:hypothetical protein